MTRREPARSREKDAEGRRALRTLARAAWIVFPLTTMAACSFDLFGAAPVASPPPPPAWVNANGTLNPAKVPAYMPVLDAQGSVAGFIEGRFLFGEPDEDKAAPVYATDQGGRVVGCFLDSFVPVRCRNLRTP